MEFKLTAKVERLKNENEYGCIYFVAEEFKKPDNTQGLKKWTLYTKEKLEIGSTYNFTGFIQEKIDTFYKNDSGYSPYMPQFKVQQAVEEMGF